MNMNKYTAAERKNLIETRLQHALAPSMLKVIDESHQHIGHAGAKGGASHFAVEVVSTKFEGLSLIKRHQLIYGALEDLIPEETAKITRDILVERGFNFHYLTNTYTNRKGMIYYFCYEFGYLPLENDWYFLVKRK